MTSVMSYLTVRGPRFTRVRQTRPGHMTSLLATVRDTFLYFFLNFFLNMFFIFFLIILLEELLAHLKLIPQ